MTKMANLPPVSTTPAVNYAYSTAGVVDIGWKFATVNDTGGKFTAGVNDTGWQIIRTISDCLHHKGTVSRDFRLLAFFLNQFPPSM